MDTPFAVISTALATTLTGALVLWPFVKPWLETLVAKRVEYAFAEKLETHKQQLDLLTEGAKYDFQKRLANASLHTSKRHEAYNEAYLAARVAHGLILNQRGIRSVPTFQEYNAADAAAYLRGRDAPEGFVEEITSQWSTNRAAAIEKLGPYARMLDLQRADNAFTAAKNSLYTNELYFSDDVVSASNSFVDAGAAILAELQYPSNSSSEWRELRDGFTKALEKMHDAMRSELAAE